MAVTVCSDMASADTSSRYPLARPSTPHPHLRLHTMSDSTPQQLINGKLTPIAAMSSEIPTLHSKAEYLKAVMYEGVREAYARCGLY
jgi:hypothetical protein